MAQTSQGNPTAAPPTSGWRLLMPLIMLLPILFLIEPGLRTALGTVAGYGLEPVIGFGGHYPLLTAILATLIPGTISTVLRHYMVDWLSMARQQHHQRALQKELMEASRRQNTGRVKKLREQQMEMSLASQQAQMDSMKPSLIMMIFFIMVFAWLGIFMYQPSTSPALNLPWANNGDLTVALLFPAWVWIYTFMSYPVYMVLGRALKYFTFTRRLREMGEMG